MKMTEHIRLFCDSPKLKLSIIQKILCRLLCFELSNFNCMCYCPPPFRRKAEGHSFWLSVIPSVRASVRLSFRPPIEYVYCVRNSSYSFTPILLKLYICFDHLLKICIWFGYNPQINFSHFFRNLNLVIFRAF